MKLAEILLDKVTLFQYQGLKCKLPLICHKELVMKTK